jgi:hypothetical protein
VLGAVPVNELDRSVEVGRQRDATVRGQGGFEDVAPGCGREPCLDLGLDRVGEDSVGRHEDSR